MGTTFSSASIEFKHDLKTVPQIYHKMQSRPQGFFFSLWDTRAGAAPGHISKAKKTGNEIVTKCIRFQRAKPAHTAA